MREPMKHETLECLGWLNPPNEPRGRESKGFIHAEHKVMDNWKPTERYDNVVPNNYTIKDFSRASKSGLRAQPNHLGDNLKGGDYGVRGKDDFLNG